MAKRENSLKKKVSNSHYLKVMDIAQKKYGFNALFPIPLDRNDLSERVNYLLSGMDKTSKAIAMHIVGAMQNHYAIETAKKLLKLRELKDMY